MVVKIQFSALQLPRHVRDVAWEQNYVNSISWQFLGLPPVLKELIFVFVMQCKYVHVQIKECCLHASKLIPSHHTWFRILTKQYSISYTLTPGYFLETCDKSCIFPAPKHRAYFRGECVTTGTAEGPQCCHGEPGLHVVTCEVYEGLLTASFYQVEEAELGSYATVTEHLHPVTLSS